MKYAVDSTGDVFRLSEANELRELSTEARAEELKTFISEFFGENDKVFCLEMQKERNIREKERVLFFTKTPLSSSSQEVKLANELEIHPEITGKERESLQSIFSDNSTGAPCWYSLGVGCIEFERNMYDNVCVNVHYASPIPFVQFINGLETKETDNTHTLLTDVDLTNIGALLNGAFKHSIAFDQELDKALEQYKQAHGYYERDPNSNKATSCLTAITEYKENCFPVYQQAKKCIKKTFEGAYNIRYKGNRITACCPRLDGSSSDTDQTRRLELYVVQNDPPVFIIGGTVINGIEAFKEALTSPDVFKEADWFAEKVKPVIETNGLKQSDYIKD